jgi:hypothetical protein
MKRILSAASAVVFCVLSVQASSDTEKPAEESVIRQGDIYVVCRLREGAQGRNPFLREFEAAFGSAFSGAKDAGAPYSAIIELAPVNDQGAVGAGLVSRRAYCIVWLYKGKVQIFSDNVSDAGIGLTGDIAGKEATIKTAKKTALRIKNFIGE